MLSVCMRKFMYLLDHMLNRGDKKLVKKLSTATKAGKYCPKPPP